MINPDGILKIIKDRHPKPVQFERHYIDDAFGFERMSGEAIMLTKLIFPSKSEKQMQMIPKWEQEKKLALWCEVNNIIYQQNEYGDYIFAVYSPRTANAE